MKAAHPFSCTPVQLHTHKTTHSFSCTPVAQVQHCSCQDVTRLCVLTVNPNWQKFFCRKREEEKSFSFSIKRNLYRFSYSIQYLSSVVKSNITGVYISTLTYVQPSNVHTILVPGPLRRWLPSVTLGHKHNQTSSCAWGSGLVNERWLYSCSNSYHTLHLTGPCLWLTIKCHVRVIR